MKIESDCVVSIHYTLKDEDNEVIDSSVDSEPLMYLHGHHQIVAGLERALLGKSPGENLSVTVAPADGYGEYDPTLTTEVDKKNFPEGASLDVGEVFEFSQEGDNSILVRITDVQGDKITVDANHPLSGMSLFFEVQVVDVRAASPEEIEHGHAHGPHTCDDDHHH